MGQRVSTMVRTTTNKGEHRRRADRWTTCRNSCTYSIQPAPTQRFGRKGQEQRWLERHGRQRRSRWRGESRCRSWWLLTAFVCFFARSDRATTREGVCLLLFLFYLKFDSWHDRPKFAKIFWTCETSSGSNFNLNQNSLKSFEVWQLPEHLPKRSDKGEQNLKKIVITPVLLPKFCEKQRNFPTEQRRSIPYRQYWCQDKEPTTKQRPLSILVSI